jgi:virulence factor Mce-like protein
MNGVSKSVDAVACAFIAGVWALTRHRVVVSCIGLVLTVVLAGTYILVSALHIQPTRSTIAVRVLLPSSGGLLPNQDVTVRGIPVGRVLSIKPEGNGVLAVTGIDSDVRIPKDSSVRVSGLSPAGEQYLDFRPVRDSGPVLTDGSTVGENQTAVPITLARLMEDSDGALAQIDPVKLSAVTNELRVSGQGSHKLSAILDGGSLLLTTLYSVLPETVSLIRNSQTVLTTLSDTTPGFNRTARNLNDILTGVNKMDGGFRTLVDRGGAPLAALDNIIADNSDTMVQLLGNLTTIAQLSYLRVPALKALFPTYRGSMFDALATTFRDGGVWGIATAYPHYGCDYNLPRRSPFIPNFPEPYLYTYCPNPDPAVLIRGARNAPRPPGDDTAGPPPGVDPLKTADPTPLGPWSIPLTYGGPEMPQMPPP